MTGCIIITNNEKWNSIFHPKLIFSILSDEHILRILFLQKIKIAKSIKNVIKIYLDDIDLDDMNISSKLYGILKYESFKYNIEICDICNGYDIDEIKSYNKIISKSTENK
tara:strand:+ start:376 stop:705 length:330 start_codon:yes stop_codon:yes gene_type:complete